jgi:Right handed beta helix region
MGRHRFTTNVIAGAVMALAFAATAQAQNNKSYIATTGNDTNNCTASAYCRTLARGLAVTNPRGEVIIVDSGDFGAATVSDPVDITARDSDASITATSGNGLTISTSGPVTITGLNLSGEGTGSNGIAVTSVGFLRLYHVQIQGFASDGIAFAAAGGDLAVYDSKINDCGHDGLLLQAAGAHAYVHDSAFDDNGFAGADSAQGLITVADSSAHYNEIGFFADGGRVELYGDRAIFNVMGMAATSGALYFADCLVADNTDSYVIVAPGTMAGSTPGTTLISPGQASFGTLGTQSLF